MRRALATRTFTIVLEEGEDGYYVARCIEIPEAISQGKTKKQAKKNITEAIAAVLEWRQKKAKGKPTELIEVSV